jgi:hypothetical protein
METKPIPLATPAKPASTLPLVKTVVIHPNHEKEPFVCMAVHQDEAIKKAMEYYGMRSSPNVWKCSEAGPDLKFSTPAEEKLAEEYAAKLAAEAPTKVDSSTDFPNPEPAKPGSLKSRLTETK